MYFLLTGNEGITPGDKSMKKGEKAPQTRFFLKHKKGKLSDKRCAPCGQGVPETGFLGRKYPLTRGGLRK
ncbi:MAG: hypothetical protein D6714_15355 [Bacteroidetes bacterium]|nr:MAG: hypothetical protein D6714_15355 [Bacteroidota bacterium]